MNAKKELKEVLEKCWKEIKDNEGICLSGIVQSILDAGYVKLTNVKIDKKKVEEKLSGCGISEHYNIPFIAKVIAEAKGILKIKEGK